MSSSNRDFKLCAVYLDALRTCSAFAGGEGLLSRKSSDNVYDNFPCVRVGDYNLPSSMDLRQYLDEMQEVGDWEDDPPADLPTIPDDEVSVASCSSQQGDQCCQSNVVAIPDDTDSIPSWVCILILTMRK